MENTPAHTEYQQKLLLYSIIMSRFVSALLGGPQQYNTETGPKSLKTIKAACAETQRLRNRVQIVKTQRGSVKAGYYSTQALIRAPKLGVAGFKFACGTQLSY